MDDVGELAHYIISTIRDSTHDEELHEYLYVGIITGLNKYGFKQWSGLYGLDPLFDQLLEERKKK